MELKESKRSKTEKPREEACGRQKTSEKRASKTKLFYRFCLFVLGFAFVVYGSYLLFLLEPLKKIVIGAIFFVCGVISIRISFADKSYQEKTESDRRPPPEI